MRANNLWWCAREYGLMENGNRHLLIFLLYVDSTNFHFLRYFYLSHRTDKASTLHVLRLHTQLLFINLDIVFVSA